MTPDHQNSSPSDRDDANAAHPWSSSPLARMLTVIGGFFGGFVLFSTFLFLISGI